MAKTLQQRFRFDKVFADTLSDTFPSNDVSTEVKVSSYQDFSKDRPGTGQQVVRVVHEKVGDVHVSVYDLCYALESFDKKPSLGTPSPRTKYADAILNVENNSTGANVDAIVPARMFPPMPLVSGDRYFLVRVYGSEGLYSDRNKKELMYQALVRRKSSPPRVEVLSFREVWY